MMLRSGLPSSSRTSSESEWPRGQATLTELADATGVSTVHVNRTLQALRHKKLIRWKDSRLEVLDWPGLRVAGDFDATYLHLRRSAWQHLPDNG
jgi:DNA-binding IclR family transcriptional regulator